VKTRQSTTTSTPTEAAPSLALERAREKRREMQARGEAFVRLDPIQKAAANPRSAKMAIKAKCYECCGAGADPGIRATIGGCTVTLCPLHPHRPYQQKDATDAEN
jgi:hypothetical protein